MIASTGTSRHLTSWLTLFMGLMLAFGVSASSADARKRNSSAQEIPQDTITGSPVMAIVSIKNQRVTVYDAEGGSMSARVSSGRTDYETPVGIYSVLQKEEEHHSNLYDDASMPFMQRITWSGIALHAGQLPGYPASHGCVRLPDSYAQRLFPMTRIGMRVIIAYDDTAPVAISHPLLMKPTPPASAVSAVAIPMSYTTDDSGSENAFEPDLTKWPARKAELEALKSIVDGKRIEADAATDQAKEFEDAIAEKTTLVKTATRTLKRADTSNKAAAERVTRADKALADARNDKAKKRREDEKARAEKAAADATTKLAAATEALKLAEQDLQGLTERSAPFLKARDAAVASLEEAKRRTRPMSVFISLKNQRIYVRQGYEAVFDAPITISEPDKPIGTHVFTAVDYANGGNDVRWTAVSLEHRDGDYASNETPRQLSDAGGVPMTDAAQAAAALDRITIPPEVAARLSSAVWPGSSMIISDEAASKETGKATDFIVLISTEPQGGIKKRPKQMFRGDNFGSDSAEDFYYGYDQYGRRRAYPRQKSFFGWW
jgi:hypothetical protein